MSLTSQNIESELSYAYLHAIAGKAGMSCKMGDRHDDAYGVEYVSYFFQGVKRYDKLRVEDSFLYKILVVLFLPQDPLSWLNCSEDELILKNCAYWVCLYGAEETNNSHGQTVYLPRKQLLTPTELIRLANLAANKKVPTYKRPS